MSQTATKLYMHLTASTAPTGLTLPAGALGTWTVTTSANVGATAGDLSFVPMTAQVTKVGQTLATSGNTNLFSQFVSCPLDAQAQIAAANWTVGFALTSATTTSRGGRASLFLCTSAGAIRTTIFGGATPATIGAAQITAVERTAFSTTVAGAAFTPSQGDYLVLEIGWRVNASTSTTATLDTSGTTAIASDNATTSSAQAFITAPAALTFTGQYQFFTNQTLSYDSANLVHAPAGALGTYTNTTTAEKGAGANYLQTVAQAAQKTVAVNSIAASTTVLLSQFLSDTIQAVNIPAALWQVAYAATASSASASYTGFVGIYLVNGGTGAIRTTLFTAGAVGVARSSTSELTLFDTVSGIAGTVTAGDYIAIELGASNGVGATANFTLDTDGTTAITTDNSAVASAKAVVSCQYSVLPQFTPITDTGGGAVTSAATLTPVLTVQIAPINGKVAASSLSTAGTPQGVVLSMPNNPYSVPNNPYAKPPLGTQLNIMHPLARELRAAFLVNEGTGRTLTNSTLSNIFPSDAQRWTGTATTFVPSSRGTVLQVKQVTVSTDRPNSAATSYATTATDSATMAVWLNASTLSSGYYGVFWLQNGGVTVPFSISLDLGGTNAGKINWEVNDTFGTVHSILSPALSTSTWYHIVATYDNRTDTANLYINGVLSGTNAAFLGGAGKMQVVTNCTLSIGDTDATEILLVDTPMWWGRALSANDVLQLYTAPYAMFDRSLLVLESYTLQPILIIAIIPISTGAVSSPNVIVSSGTVADSPGLGQNAHMFYAVNSAKWWWFGFKSASSTTLYARYSTDNGVTWNDPTNNTKTIAHSNQGSGRALALAYANISSTDVVHFDLYYKGNAGQGTGDQNSYLRATLSGTTVTWGTEADINDQGANTNGVFIAPAVAIASDGRIVHSLGADNTNGGDFDVARSTNADTGSAWTAGFPGTPHLVNSGTLLFSSTNTVTSSGLAALSSAGKVITLGDNGAVTGTPTDVLYSLFGGSSWSPSTATSAFGSTASIDSNDWGFCLRTDTDAHAVRRNNATSTFTHRRWNGTSWVAGDTIGNNTCKAGAGLAMVSDGVSVWLFIIDSNGANTVRYNKWMSGSGWGGWTASEISTQVRNFITVEYSSTQNLIGASWAQTNGANFDVIFEALNLPDAGSVSVATLTPLLLTLVIIIPSQPAASSLSAAGTPQGAVLSMPNSPYQKPPLGSQIEENHRLTKDILAFWIFNEGTGKKVSSIWPPNIPLTLNNATGLVGSTSTWYPSRLGTSVVEGAVDDFVRPETNGASITWGKKYSQVVWFTPTLVQTSKTILQTDANSHWIMGSDPTTASKLNFTYKDNANGTPTATTAAGVLVNGTPVHVVATVDETVGTIIIYINGVQSVKTTGLNVYSNSNIVGNIAVGHLYGGAGDLQGLYSYVMSVNRILSADEVQQLYMAPYGMIASPIIALESYSLKPILTIPIIPSQPVASSLSAAGTPQPVALPGAPLSWPLYQKPVLGAQLADPNAFAGGTASLLSHLLLAYVFNEGTGQPYDSVSGNKLTVGGTTPPIWAGTPTGRSMLFNDNQGSSLSGSINFNLSNRSFSVMVVVNTHRFVNNATLIAFGSNIQTTNAVFHLRLAFHLIRYSFYGSDWDVSLPSSLSGGVQHILLATFYEPTKTRKLYLDGNLLGTENALGVDFVSSGTTLAIGADAWNLASNNMIGNMLAAYVFGKELSGDEARMLSAAPYSIYESNLRGTVPVSYSLVPLLTGGGSTLTVTISDTVVPSDTISFAAANTESDTLTATESSAFARSESNADTLVPNDALADTLGNNQADTNTNSDTAAFAGADSISDTLGQTDTGATSGSTSSADTISPSDTFANFGATSVNDTETGETDNLADTLGKSIADTVSPSDTLSLTLGSNQADTLVPSDTATFSGADSISDTLSGTDTLANSGSAGGSDTLVPNDTLAATLGSNQSDTLIPADTLAFAVACSPSDTVVGADTLAIARSTSFSDAATGTDTLTNTYGNAQTDTIIPTDTLATTFLDAITDSVVPLDAILFSSAASLSDTLIPSDTLINSGATSINDSGPAPADTLADTLGSNQADTVVVADTLAFAAVSALSDIVVDSSTTAYVGAQSTSDTNTPADALATTFQSTQTDTLAQSADSVTFVLIDTLSDTVTGADSATFPNAGAFSDSTSPNDAAAYAASFSANDTDAETDTVADTLGSNQTDTVVPNDTILATLNSQQSDSIVGSDTAIFVAANSISDTPSPLDTSSYDIAGTFSDTNTETDTTTYASPITVAFSDTVVPSDTATFATAASSSDTNIDSDTALYSGADSIADTLGNNDATNTSGATSASDTTAPFDALAIVFQYNQSDTATSVDTATFTLIDTINDTGGAADTATFSSTDSLSDTITGTDTTTNTGAATATDTISPPVDTLAITLGSTQSDTDAVTDTVLIAQGNTQSDTGTATDTISYSTADSIADTPSPLDTSSYTATGTFDDPTTETDTVQAFAPTLVVQFTDTVVATDDGGSFVATNSITDTPAPVDTSSYAATGTFSDTATETDTLASASPLSITFSDSIVVAEDTSFILEDSLADSVVPADTGTFAAITTLADMLTNTDTVASTLGSSQTDVHVLTDTITFQSVDNVDDTATETESIAFAAAASFNDNNTAADTLTFSNSISFSDTGVPQDTATSSTTNNFSDSATMADAPTFAAATAPADTSVGGDATAIAASQSFSDTATTADTYTNTPGANFTDTNNLSDTAASSGATSTADTATSHDTNTLFAQNSEADSVGNSDSATYVLIDTISDTPSPLDTNSIAVSGTFSDSATETDTVFTTTPNVIIAFSDTLTPADTFSCASILSFSDSENQSDTLAILESATYADTVVPTDSTVPVHVIAFTDTATGVDTATNSIQGAIADSTGVGDAANYADNTSFQDTISSTTDTVLIKLVLPAANISALSSSSATLEDKCTNSVLAATSNAVATIADLLTLHVSATSNTGAGSIGTLFAGTISANTTSTATIDALLNAGIIRAVSGATGGIIGQPLTGTITASSSTISGKLYDKIATVVSATSDATGGTFVNVLGTFVLSALSSSSATLEDKLTDVVLFAISATISGPLVPFVYRLPIPRDLDIESVVSKESSTITVISKEDNYFRWRKK